MTNISDVAGDFKRRVEETQKIALKDRMNRRLTEMGLKPIQSAGSSPSQIRCALECPICHGDGYTHDNPKAKPTDRDFGRVTTCPNFAVRQIKEKARSGDWDVRIGITALEIEMSWDLVKKDLSDGMKAVSALRPAQDKGYGMVMLRGSYGQAKTLVGKILTATSLLSGKRAAYANMARILDDIRLAFDSKEAKSIELLRRMDWWIGLDVLFIDEIDRVNATDWAQERMFQLLDQRYTRAIREEALTVVASNAPLKELDGYLVSRLKDNRLGPIVDLNGTDGRLVMPEGHKF